MTAPISLVQRQEIVSLLKEGLNREDIAAQLGVTVGQVSAVKAHISNVICRSH